MTQSYIEKNVEQLQQFFNEPNKFLKQAQEAQIEFMNQLSIFWQEFPQAYQQYLFEQQQKAQQLHAQLSDTWKQKPNDWAALGSVISDFNTEQFSNNIEKLQHHQERWQRLLAPYTSLDMPFFFKDILEQTQAELTKLTNEMLSTGQKKVDEINQKTKENLQTTQRVVNEAQEQTQQVVQHVTEDVQKQVKKATDVAQSLQKKATTKPAVKVASKTSVRANSKENNKENKETIKSKKEDGNTRDVSA